jgi:hypothetical protein
MVACLVREWATVRAEEGITKASTVFFGGGTPSLMDPGDVEKILRKFKLTLKGLWRNLHISLANFRLSKETSIICLTNTDAYGEGQRDIKFLCYNFQQLLSSNHLCLTKQSLPLFSC